MKIKKLLTEILLSEKMKADGMLEGYYVYNIFIDGKTGKIFNAAYTYEYKKTDNLLDYSHHVTGHKNSRCSLWYWQWKKANQSIK